MSESAIFWQKGVSINDVHVHITYGRAPLIWPHHLFNLGYLLPPLPLPYGISNMKVTKSSSFSQKSKGLINQLKEHNRDPLRSMVLFSRHVALRQHLSPTPALLITMIARTRIPPTEQMCILNAWIIAPISYFRPSRGMTFWSMIMWAMSLH